MPARLISAVREFTRSITGSYDVDDVLDSLVLRAMEAHEALGAGIMLRGEDGQLGFAAASDDHIHQIEMIQHRVDEGACHDAFVTGEPQLVGDLATESRWPHYTGRARQLGVAAVLAVPMYVAGQKIGALNIYRRQPTDWTEQDRDNAEILASMGAAYIYFSARLQEQIELAEQLQYALDSRVVIEQAKGYLMSQRSLTDRDAIELIRDHARSNHRRLAEVAQDILARRIELPQAE